MTDKKLVFVALAIGFTIASPVVASKIQNFLGGFLAVACIIYAGYCLWCLSREQ